MGYSKVSSFNLSAGNQSVNPARSHPPPLFTFTAVETIGDCYVAVTGQPKPQKHQATIMAKFASECLLEIQMVTAELEETLGPGTRNLRLRVGLHSGPVTGQFSRVVLLTVWNLLRGTLCSHLLYHFVLK